MTEKTPADASTTTSDTSTTTSSVTTAVGDNRTSPAELMSRDYKTVFANSLIPMAIAQLGGAFVEANLKWDELTGISTSELLAMTIFNITKPENLQQAFDGIAKLIANSADSDVPAPVRIPGLVKSGDCEFVVSLVKDAGGESRYFCLQMLQQPAAAEDHAAATGDGMAQNILG